MLDATDDPVLAPLPSRTGILTGRGMRPRLSVGLVLALGLGDWAWNLGVGLRFTDWMRPAVAFAALVVISLFYRRVRYSPPIAEATFFAAAWIAFTAFGCIFTYLAASLALPLQDGEFARVDAAMGFDWHGWVGCVAAHPAMQKILALSYATLMPQIIVCVLVFSFRRVPGRNEELLAGAALTLIVTALLSGALPALGPAVIAGPGTLADADTFYATHVALLRHGSFIPEFALGRLQGIITFPSFHASQAVLFTYAHRGLRWTAVPVAVVNAVMLLSIPSEGGHYLADVLAGVALAVAAIVAIGRARQLIAPASQPM